MKKGWFALLLLLGLDLLTKVLAIRFIPPLTLGAYPFGGIPVFSMGGVTFSLNYVVNTGMAWGLFGGYPGILFTLRLAIIGSLLFFMPKRLPVWLILTGAIGNVLDYCLYGHVIDFFHFTFWDYSFPIFNVADACITIGVFLLLVLPNRAKELQMS